MKNKENDSSFVSTFVTKGLKYVIFIIIYMMLYDYFDTYTSSFYQVVVSHIQEDLQIANSEWYEIISVASIGLFGVLIVQYLTDIWGRKPMMIVVFLGMGVSSLLLGFVKTKAGFAAVFFFMWLFFSSDIWIIIMAEEAPKERRGLYLYLITFLAAFGAVTIPIVRDLVVTPDPSSWRKMTYWAYMAIPFALLGLFMKETAAFRKEKAQRSKQKLNFQQKMKKFVQPFQQQYWKPLMVFIITGFLLGICFAANTTQEVFITSIVEVFIADEQAAIDLVTDIVFVITLGGLFFQIISGWLADRIGRKPLIVAYMVLNSISAILFGVLSPILGDWSNFLALKLFGFCWIGTFWAVYLMTKTYCVECFPTDIRGTASGWRAFSYALGLTLGGLLSSWLVGIITIGELFAITSTLVGIVGIPLTLLFLPETKGTDLDKL